MKNCFRKCCCAVFCCTCCGKTAEDVTNQDTILLPIQDATRQELETENLYIFGSVPLELQKFLLEGYGRNPVVKIACGKYHYIILLTNNRLIGFGLNNVGQLGLPVETKEVTQITELKINLPNENLGDFEILDIAAGDEYSLILIRTQDNHFKIIKFGMDNIHKYINPHNVSFQKIEKLPDTIFGNITNIIAFEKRKIFWTEQNEVYLGGRDFYGTELDDYILLKKFQTKIKNIFLLKESCYVQDEENEIFILGENSYRELGYEVTSVNDFVPFCFEFTKSKIKKLCAGARHVLFLLENGELFCLGDNSEGQCCGANSTCNTPYRIELNSKLKVLDCYAGYNHNLIILENGSVYTWGNTNNGKLGYFEDNFSQEVPKELFQMKIVFINKVCLGNEITVIVGGKEEDSIINKLKPKEPELIEVENH